MATVLVHIQKPVTGDPIADEGTWSAFRQELEQRMPELRSVGGFDAEDGWHLDSTNVEQLQAICQIAGKYGLKVAKAEISTKQIAS